MSHSQVRIISITTTSRDILLTMGLPQTGIGTTIRQSLKGLRPHVDSNNLCPLRFSSYGLFTLLWQFQPCLLLKRTRSAAQTHLVYVSLIRCIPLSEHYKEERRRGRLSMNGMMCSRKAQKLGTQTRKRPGFLPAFSRTIV